MKKILAISRLYLVLIALLPLSLPLCAYAVEWSAEIVDYGVYDTVKGQKVDSHGTAGGAQVIIAKTLKEQTTVLPAKLGLSFGFRYTLKGPKPNTRVTIKMIHPTTLKDPKTNREFTVSEWSQLVATDSVNWNTGWTFDNKWELVPGEWKLQLYSGTSLLQEKIFSVVETL